MIYVGDIVLYQKKSRIIEWEVNRVSPSGRHIAIENDDDFERWVPIRDILEVIESEHGIANDDLPTMEQIRDAAEQPIPRLRSTKDYNFEQ